MIRVLIADDNAVIREGVRSLLETLAEDIVVVGDAANGREAIERAHEVRPDVILLDIRMPVMDGIEAAGKLSREFNVMMLSYAEDAGLVTGAIKAGAAGYLVHGRFEPDQLELAIRELYAGRPVLSPSVTPTVLDALRAAPATGSTPSAVPFELTPRELEVMKLLARGETNKAIAAELTITVKTAKNHVASIYQKLGVSNRAEATAKWLGAADASENTPGRRNGPRDPDRV
jgi:DNA-binding NarL/FixJ family response regulator